MISSVRIRSFKRFLDTEFQLGDLTVLTGLNGRGKSTVVQAILLAHAASSSNAPSVPLAANPGLELGYASDVLAVDAEEPTIFITIGDGTTAAEWKFDCDSADGDRPFVGILNRAETPPSPIGAGGNLLTYLSAERLGPRPLHALDAADSESPGVGHDGRYAAHVLASGSRDEVSSELRHPDAGRVSTLKAQTEAWMSEIVGPIQIDAEVMPRTGLATLQFRTPNRSGEWMLPTNSGFGVSYVLPLIVAGLTMPVGGLLIVDSPEAHLHPSAQSAIGRFLAQVAQSGVQVVVETHSDHVLNGIRRAVVSGRSAPSGAIRLYYFGDAEPVAIRINDKGSLSEWPPGFFDQIESDLNTILGKGA
jgi:predicted ATPase